MLGNEITKSEFETFAHNIRSPITALLVLADSEPGISADTRTLLLRIGERILEDVRGLMLPDSEKALAEELCFVPARIEALIEQKRIEFKIPPGLLVFHRGLRWRRCFTILKPSQLDATLSNLINNALEAAEFKGSVDVAVGVFGECIRITVDDDGPGFHPLIRDRVLRERVTHGKAGGSGIGLWEAERFARRLGGEIVVQSSSRGTRLTLDLPLRPIVS